MKGLLRASVWFAFAVGTAANANSFCEDIEDLIAASGASAQAGVSLELPMPQNSETTCAYARGTGGVAFIHCAWPFEFRSSQASEAFEFVTDALMMCPTARLRDFKDQEVNHPDSYDLRVVDMETGEVGLSLKDKGALQQTILFLRVQQH